MKLTTTFRVPIAVWKVLNDSDKLMFSDECSKNSISLTVLENRFKHRFDVLVESEEIASKAK